MARPRIAGHSGFLVPNAAGVGNARMSEPDQVDFNVLSSQRWGVIDGCEVIVSGTTASTTGGLAVINGQLVVVQVSDAQVGVGSADRFDLIVVDLSGRIKVIGGFPTTDPVFPDPDDDELVLAAVFCAPGDHALDDKVIDKRTFVAKALLSRVAPDADLVRNLNGTGNYFRIDGAGNVGWQGDTLLKRAGPATLEVDDNLNVSVNLTAGGGITAATLHSTGQVTGSNLRTGTVLDPTAALGTLMQSNTGSIFAKQSSGWVELATTDSAMPVGAVIQSIEPESVMKPKGWLLLNGQQVNEATDPALFTLSALVPSHIDPGSPPAPNRTMHLPNATGKFLMCSTTPLATGGAVDNKVAILLANLPAHKHGVASSVGDTSPITVETAPDGSHIHAIQPTTGAHTHNVNDPGHAHNGFDFFGAASPVIALMWGGRNKIDALFNDRNHTYSVEAMDWTRPAATNISVGNSGSMHGHVVDPSIPHTHKITFTPPKAGLSVSENSVGSDQPIDITPAYLTMYTYIKR